VTTKTEKTIQKSLLLAKMTDGEEGVLLLQELVEDVAVATSNRHADLSCARHFTVASLRFIGRRSASTVLSQDCLGRPALRLQLPGGSIMQA